MNQPIGQRHSPAVGYWLLLGVVMLLVQIVLGGITRLTGSGLSITEWNLVTGALPPLSQSDWIGAFNKYKGTPQFHLLHADFGLSDFKFIFFWEWVHRFWARLVGVVFLVGFGWLIWKKKMDRSMVKPMVVLFLLGAMQGLIGWIMVVSGLTGDAIYVKPTRLALHFIFALGLLSYTYWFALQVLRPSEERVKEKGVRRWPLTILLLLIMQLLYGALMAGHRAAAAAPTWPRVNGDWIPPGLFSDSPLLLNFIENKITIQFFHRLLAYALLVCTTIWTFHASRLRQTPWMKRTKWTPLALIVIQVILGISAVLASPGIVANRWVFFDWMGLAHQLTAILFLLSMIRVIFYLRPRKSHA
jgi:heme a synthase